MYIAALQDLADRFLELVEEALEVRPGVLKAFTGPQDRLKVVHYRSNGEHQSGKSDSKEPNGSSAATDGFEENYIQGVGLHKDSFGWMTFPCPNSTYYHFSTTTTHR